MTIKHKIHLTFSFLVLILFSCNSKEGCSFKKNSDDLNGFVPADVSAAAELDLKSLSESAAGLKIIDSLVKKDDCLYPMITKEVETVFVGYRRGKAGRHKKPPFCLLACSRCNFESLTGCMSRDFGLSFDDDASFSSRGLKFISSDSDPAVYMSRLKKNKYFIGSMEDARAVADVAAGERPALAGSEELSRLKASVPKSAELLVVVLKGNSFRTSVLGQENELAADFSGVGQAACGLSLSEGEIRIAGKMFLDAGTKQSPKQIASSLNGKLLMAASNPVAKQVGLSHILKKLKFKPDPGGWVDISFTIKEKELFNLLEARQEIFTLGL